MSYLSFDLETSIQSYIEEDKKGNKKRVKDLHGPSAHDPRNDFYSIIFGNHPDRIKMLHKKKGFKRQLPFRFKRALKSAHTIVGVNLKFDLSYIWDNKCFKSWLKRGGKIWDIQLVHYLLTAQRHSFPSLAEMQKIYLEYVCKDESITRVFKRNIGADKIIKAKDMCPQLWKDYEHYGIESDGKTPLYIMKKQYKKAKQMGMLPVIELYNQYLLALTMIECNGLPIDIPNTQIRHQEFSLKVVEWMEKAQTEVEHLWTDWRLPALNINSSAHAAAILFGGKIKCTWKEDTGKVYGPKAQKAGQKKYKPVEGYVEVKGFGVPTIYTEKTPGGKWATGEPIRQKIAKSIKNKQVLAYCHALKQAKAYQQKISTYLNAFLYRSINGVVHPNYNNTETVTSRLSASRPNVQNIPKHGEWGKLIQGLIAAPTGWVCCQLDFSQLEVYCRALLSNDTALINDLASGKDFHCQNVSWWKEVSYEEAYDKCKVQKLKEWDSLRSQAKPISFGEAYGQMPQGMAENTGIPLEIVEQVYKSMQENYPGIVKFEESVVKEVQRSAKLSRKSSLPAKYTKGTKNGKSFARQFVGDMELLPIRQRDRKTYKTERGEPRHVGYYRSMTGKRYAFDEYGSITKRGDIFRYFKPTQMKNYAMQGTAGDVQAITTAAMFQYLLANEDIVKIINEIHDSKWFLIREEHVHEVVPKLKQFMEDARQLLEERFKLNISFEFKADAEVGPNFAELEEYQPLDMAA